MSQAMFTSASGMANAQTAINVVSNNIANMNTVAFKESHVNFSDVFYGTLSSGAPSSKTNGGVNPKEIGYGSQVAQISQKFTTGTFQSTGVSTDVMIQGNGFFTVLNPANEMLYTKAGNFTVDTQGYLVMPNGYKVMGTNTIFGSSSSKTPIKIPQMIHSEVTANAAAGSKNLSELNGISGITAGDFTMNFTYTYVDGAGDTQIARAKAKVTLDGSEANLNEIAIKIKNALNSNVKDATTGAALTLPDDVKNRITAGVNANGEFSIDYSAATDIQSFSLTAGSSNFLSELQISGTENPDKAFTSKVVDWKAEISASVNSQLDLKAAKQDIYENGAVEVTYSNGDKLTVQQNETTNQLEFKYSTKAGIILSGSEVSVSDAVATPANLQIQLAHFLNPDGLSQEGNNLYGLGINNGSVLYGIADSNLFGSIKSGGLEASNVDLTKQFSDMIIAQRSIEANSRVFNTANQVMQSLVYLGQ